MHIEHIGIDNDKYWAQLSAEQIDENSKRQIFEFIDKKGWNRIIVYGANKSTGKRIRDIIGNNFFLYLNSETISPNISFDFNAILISTSPRHYTSIIKKIRNDFGSKDITIVTIFNDEPCKPTPGKLIQPTPCHIDQVFVRFDGDIFPCCMVWQNKDKKICNIVDNNILESFKSYNIGCACKSKVFRPLMEGESIEINLIAFELSLLCNSSCAMCCAHSPEYTRDFGNKAHTVDYKNIEKTIQILNPKKLFFQGGEVLIDKKSIKWIESIKKKFDHIEFYLVTNGNVPFTMANTIYDIFDLCWVDFYGFQKFTYKTITTLPLERVLKFSERLIEISNKKTILKYLSTPINIHEIPLFLEWAIEKNPKHVVVNDANSHAYIKNDQYLKEPVFNTCGNNGILPQLYWNRILNRSFEKINKTVEKYRSYCIDKKISISIHGGIFNDQEQCIAIDNNS